MCGGGGGGCLATLEQFACLHPVTTMRQKIQAVCGGGGDVLEGGEGRGVLLGPPSSSGPPKVPAKGGPKALQLESSWHQSKISAISLKYWKGRGGGWLVGCKTWLWRLATAPHAGTLLGGRMPRPRKEVCAPLLPLDRSPHSGSRAPSLGPTPLPHLGTI